MKKQIKMLASATLLIAFSGCSMKSSHMAIINPTLSNTNVKYDILESTSGSAGCIAIFSFFEIGETSGCAFPFAKALFGIETDNIESVAMSKAIDGIPKADAMLAPRFTATGFTIPIIYNKKTITVKGKAIEFK